MRDEDGCEDIDNGAVEGDMVEEPFEVIGAIVVKAAGYVRWFVTE